MPQLYTKVFAERNCGGQWLARILRKNFATNLMRGENELPRQALRDHLQEVRSNDRVELHNTILDVEHDRLLYSDFGWMCGAIPHDILRAAPHAKDTLCVMITVHPLIFVEELRRRPRTPGQDANAISLERFLNTPFPIYRRDGIGQIDEMLPLELWAAKMRAGQTLHMTVKTARLFQAERISANPTALINDLAIDLRRTTQEPELPPEGFGDLPNLRSGRAEQLWKNLPTAEQNLVESVLPADLLEQFGYQLAA